MKQYAQVKARYPDTILLFRMGDFYETFEDDARTTSSVLGITLTKRGNGTAGEVPLAGFPHHSLDSYLPKLVKAGYRVAICEQLEDPRLAKGIVKRDVIEVVTPGVAFSDKVLEQKQNNFLAAVALPSAVAAADDPVGFAFIDVSTAEFRAGEFPLRQLREQIGAVGPSEVIVQKRDHPALQQLLGQDFRGMYTKRDDWLFNLDYAHELLLSHFQTKSLKGFGLEGHTLGLVASGAVMNYLEETQKANLLHIKKLLPHNVGDHITLDPSTKRNLEITSSLSGSSEGTLFSVLDRTRTPMGGRLLKRWINQPLNQVDPIRQRLEAVAEFTQEKGSRETVADILTGMGDLERLNARICTARANPRELNAMKSALSEVCALKEALTGLNSEYLVSIRDALDPLEPIIGFLEGALEEDPPMLLSDGGVLKRGYNSDLDSLRDLATSGKEWIAKLQRTERERTGIPSLKVGFNNVFGYYIEVTHTHKTRIPQDYIRKQTLTNAERYITPQLKEYEEKVLHAEEKILSLETRLFNEVRLEVAEHAEAIQEDASAIAAIDSLVSLAAVAVAYDYVCPEVNDGLSLEIHQGRHPVIERLLPPGEQYVPNDVRINTDDEQILIITGPNMSGKSSYLRQAGLIVLLAQIGSFVPAKKATIGIVDKIFTRVGASDNIASGESTFLVEMHEAAHIVNTSTKRSLILLDEVGRGTSTFDGISIAWALTEYLHEHVGARTLFATHYHELNELAEILARIRNYKVEVREYGDKVVFLHKVSPGFADHSYGIQVAQMAGLPGEVTDRAKAILHNLESSDLSVHDGGEGGRSRGRMLPDTMQLTLFEARDDVLRQQLRSLDIDNMTPVDALKALAELKKALDKK
ncbi:MAG: DNA mismatch repair protein MutS [Bacteroidota bacterium]